MEPHTNIRRIRVARSMIGFLAALAIEVALPSRTGPAS
jgi:hypothetical protein